MKRFLEMFLNIACCLFGSFFSSLFWDGGVSMLGFMSHQPICSPVCTRGWIKRRKQTKAFRCRGFAGAAPSRVPGRTVCRSGRCGTEQDLQGRRQAEEDVQKHHRAHLSQVRSFVEFFWKHHIFSANSSGIMFAPSLSEQHIYTWSTPNSRSSSPYPKSSTVNCRCRPTSLNAECSILSDIGLFFSAY